MNKKSATENTKLDKTNIGVVKRGGENETQRNTTQNTRCKTNVLLVFSFVFDAENVSVTKTRIYCPYVCVRVCVCLSVYRKEKKEEVSLVPKTHQSHL